MGDRIKKVEYRKIMQHKIESFKDLIVWQKSADLTVLVYKYTDNFPRSELNGIVNQIRRAVVSVSSNIAEGFKRSHKKEKIQFYNIAFGSISEVESQIEISEKLNYINNEEKKEMIKICIEISKMINGLIKSTKNNISKHSSPYLLPSIFFVLFSIFYLLSPNSALAANVSLSVPNSIKIGDNLDVTVNADTDGTLINSAEITVNYDTALLSFSGYSDSNSVIKLWINPPTAQNGPNAQVGQVSFSGIIPGGVAGLYDASKKGLSPFPLVHLLFTPKNIGTTNLSFASVDKRCHSGSRLRHLWDCRKE